jgi:hypothetical protein
LLIDLKVKAKKAEIGRKKGGKKTVKSQQKAEIDSNKSQKIDNLTFDYD